MSERGWNDPPDYLFQNNKTTTNNAPRLYRLYGKRQTPSALASATPPTNFLNKDNGPPIPAVPPPVPVGILDKSHPTSDTDNTVLSPANGIDHTFDKMLECFRNMLDKCKESLDAETKDEIEKKLQELDCKCHSDSLSRVTADSLSAIYNGKFITNEGDYGKANEICTALATNNDEEVDPWIAGIRKLIQQHL